MTKLTCSLQPPTPGHLPPHSSSELFCCFAGRLPGLTRSVTARPNLTIFEHQHTPARSADCPFDISHPRQPGKLQDLHCDKAGSPPDANGLPLSFVLDFHHTPDQQL